MKKIFAILGILQVLLLGAVAQTPDDPNEGSRLEYDSANTIWRFKWWARSGRTYFVQHSDNLMSAWQWVPAVESGNDSIKEWGLTSTGDKLFLRLKYSDQATSDPEGDDFDLDGVPNLYEVQHGNSPFAIEDSDLDGLPDGWLDVHAGTFAIFPPSRLTASLSRNQTAPGKIYLNNDTATEVNYSVAVSANAGPNYAVSGNATYQWEDISFSGTKLNTISNAWSGYESVNIGFAFPFYGQTYSQVSVDVNGLLVFTNPGYSDYNYTIPYYSTYTPAAMIAPLWDDLETSTAGDIYYKAEASRVIVQYEAVKPNYLTGSYTFQVVLNSSGTIQFRYKTLSGLTNSYTVGIQDQTRTLGLRLAYNTAYLSDGMAVDIVPSSEFFSILPTSGTVAPHSRVTLDGLFQSLQLPFGDYTANVSITHDGGAGSPLNLTANLNVKNVPTVVNITSPTNQDTVLQGQTVTIMANATDVDSQIVKVEFFDNGVKLGEDTYSSYQNSWTPTDAGSHTLTAKSTDVYGESTMSAVIPIQVLPDADQDRMDDTWETAYGLDIAKNDAMEDLDGDRVPNIFEYYRETLPNDDTSYPAVDFVVDPATGNASYQDLTYATIYEAVNKANEYVWNAQTSQYDRPNAWAVIEAKSGIYQEEVYLSDMPVLLLAELGSPQGPVEIRSPSGYGVYLYTTCGLDGFVITHNSGVEESGVYSYSYGSNNPSRALTNCIIKGNKSTYGGGIYNEGNSVLRVAHCTIIGNQASYYGPAIYNGYSSKIELVNSIIWDNTGAAPSAIYQDPYAPVGAFAGGPTSIIQGGEQGGINENPLVNPSGYLTTSSSPASNRSTTILAKASRVDIHGISRLVNSPPDLGVEEWMDGDTDGLPDWFELTGITDPAGDNDSDFVSNLQEYALGLSSSNTDTDGDGLSDGDELYADSTHGDTDGYVTNALSSDTDNDGMSDSWESANGFNPTVVSGAGDADTDGLTDLQEYVAGTNPHLGDTDEDTMPDYYEVTKGLDPTRNDASEDPDRDELTNIQEYNLGTHPKNFDTDGDLLADGWEVTCGLNPLVANSSNSDTDTDGLTDFQEMVYGTDPTLSDTDGDGALDGQEANQGSLPNDPSDNGLPPSEEEKLTVKIIVGDPSGSHSERWRVSVKDLDIGNTILNHQSPAFGELSSDASSTFSQFRKGHSYELSLIHVGTDPQKMASDPEGDFFPDYDWALEVSTQDTSGQFSDVRSSSSIMTYDPWDPQSQNISSTIQLLVARDELSFPWEGQPDRTQQYESQIASKRVILAQVEIVPDDGMVGVVGDMVPSNKDEGGEKHFVTPKKAAIDNDYVIFKAKGVSASLFDKLFEWGPEGEALAGEPLKRKVSREVAAKTALTIKKKGTTQEAAKMNVWVVWATSGIRNVPAMEYYNRTNRTLVDGTSGNTANIIAGAMAEERLVFGFTIYPSGICDVSQDIPNLTGPNEVAPPGGNSPFDPSDQAQNSAIHSVICFCAS